jgi:hypothetical protein
VPVVRSRSFGRGFDERGSLSSRSLDPPRQRPVPDRVVLVNAEGVEQSWTLQTRSVIVAVKTNCDGCHSFYEGSHHVLSAWPVLLIAQHRHDLNHFAGSAHRVFASSELWSALDIRSAPFYLLVAPDPGRIVAEGLAFSPEQVQREISDAGV